MRRFISLLSTTLLVTGLLLGPGASAVAAAPATHGDVGFTCSPNGTLPGAPTTQNSVVLVDFSTPANSRLLCSFRGLRLIGFGGPCVYETAAFRVDFRFRILLPGPTASGLVCAGATITRKAFTLTTIVHYGGDGIEPHEFDSIVYTDGGTHSCTAWPEDSATACTQVYPPGTVVTVTFTDAEQMSWECVPDFIENDTSLPYEGTCVVTMDADRTITIVGNLQL